MGFEQMPIENANSAENQQEKIEKKEYKFGLGEDDFDKAAQEVMGAEYDWGKANLIFQDGGHTETERQLYDKIRTKFDEQETMRREKKE